MNVTKVIKGGVSVCVGCGKHTELRPYGKGGAWVCFDCAMKDEKEAERQFGKLLDADVTIVDTRGEA